MVLKFQLRFSIWTTFSRIRFSIWTTKTKGKWRLWWKAGRHLWTIIFCNNIVKILKYLKKHLFIMYLSKTFYKGKVGEKRWQEISGIWFSALWCDIGFLWEIFLNAELFQLNQMVCKLTAKIQQLKKQDKKLLITSQWKRAGSQ